MTGKRIKIEHTDFRNLFGLERDYRATVGSLKKALENFDDDLPIGVLYDSEMAYCDIHEICIQEGLVKLIGD